MNVKEAYLAGREHLAAAGSSESSIEAEVLLRRAAGWDRTALYTRWDSPLPDGVWDRYRAMLDDRARGRPVHYIVGEREFMGLSFLVDERVLIPRPETETLVEKVIEFLEGESQVTGHESRPIVVDVGTGSGCVAVSIAHSVPPAKVFATDISSGALEVAAENARRHGVSDRIEFLAGDLLEPLPPGLARHIDAVVSNPPYVPEELAASLPREIRDFEPAVAVVGRGDGLDVHRSLAASAPRWLRDGGLLALEVGAGQAPALRGFLESLGRFSDISILKDYAGIDRVVAARAKG